MTKHYLAMWDSQGLECLFDVGFYMDQYHEWEKQKVISILKEERVPDQPRGVPLQMLSFVLNLIVNVRMRFMNSIVL